LGSNLWNAILAIGITYIPRVVRVVRSATIGLKNEEFVIAARARGESDAYIVFQEILPNIWSVVIVEAGIRIGFAIILGAALSYLGLGVQPPAPGWGLMIYEARKLIFMAPWTLIFPSVFLALIIISFNILGDGLRRLLDPRERRDELI
jgi:peptide/nickel transport system permease protein